jgi:hypothetical protein
MYLPATASESMDGLRKPRKQKSGDTLRKKSKKVL